MEPGPPKALATRSSRMCFFTSVRRFLAAPFSLRFWACMRARAESLPFSRRARVTVPGALGASPWYSKTKRSRGRVDAPADLLRPLGCSREGVAGAGAAVEPTVG